jgi:hypothetical protein
MTRLSKAILVSAAFLTSALGANAEPANSALLDDAKSFMKSYATDLQIGNRDAVSNRYDARGAYFVGQGKKTFMTVEQIKKTYQESWKPPASFAWSDLSYEVIGNNAVVVVGGFDLGISDKKALHFSYSALLVRSDGNLRIRLEDESPLPPQPASTGDAANDRK